MSKNTPAKAKRPAFYKRWDFWLVVGITVVALILGLVLRTGRESGGVALVTVVGSEETVRISLGEDGLYDIEGGMLPVTLQVENGRIRFVSSQCPDHLCERHGWMENEGDWMACMPAGVSVLVQ